MPRPQVPLNSAKARSWASTFVSYVSARIGPTKPRAIRGSPRPADGPNRRVILSSSRGALQNDTRAECPTANRHIRPFAPQFRLPFNGLARSDLLQPSPAAGRFEDLDILSVVSPSTESPAATRSGAFSVRSSRPFSAQYRTETLPDGTKKSRTGTLFLAVGEKPSGFTVLVRLGLRGSS
jgi:hypothetical protein